MSHDRGCAITFGYNACTCPTPVPSEADPGTGEPWHWADARLSDPTPATPDAGDVEALAIALCDSNHSWPHHDATDDHPCLNCKAQAVNFLASGWLASHDAATADRVRREAAEAQRCGGCKGQGSHRRHCPRHPTYHPWIPLADRAESIGDSIGEPALANQAWALAGAIRSEMPNHPYRPVRPRDEADS